MGTKKKGGGLLMAALLVVGAGGCGGAAVVPPQNAETFKGYCRGEFPCLAMFVFLGSNKSLPAPVEGGVMSLSPIGNSQPECVRAEILKTETLPAAVTYSFTQAANGCSSGVGYDIGFSVRTPFDGRKAKGSTKFLWSDLAAEGGGVYLYREVSLAP